MSAQNRRELEEMGKKWGRKEWYEYHKGKAVSAAIEKYASSEKKALDAIDKRISDLDDQQKRLSASMTGLSGLLAIFIPNQTAREINSIRKTIEDLRNQRTTLYRKYHEASVKASARGANEYTVQREIRAEEETRLVQERRIRYLERSPAIRSAQAMIREHIIAEYSEVGEITCYYCSVILQPEEVHIEHKTPVARGGTNKRKNLALSCARCNLSKGRKTEAEFRRHIETKS